MLTIPEYGWTKLEIGKFEAPASYLTDVPIDFLHACLSVLEFGGFYSINIDSEGEDHLLVLNSDGIWVFSENPNYKTDGPEMTLNNFCLNVYKDISEHLDAWANWYLDPDPGSISGNKKTLSNLLDNLKELLRLNGVEL